MDNISGVNSGTFALFSLSRHVSWADAGIRRAPPPKVARPVRRLRRMRVMRGEVQSDVSAPASYRVIRRRIPGSRLREAHWSSSSRT